MDFLGTWGHYYGHKVEFGGFQGHFWNNCWGEGTIKTFWLLRETFEVLRGDFRGLQGNFWDIQRFSFGLSGEHLW